MKEDDKENLKKQENPNPNPNPIIKHLSISGGATWGFSAFGSLYKAIKVGFIDLEKIESCYTTSIGTMIIVMFLLKIKPDILMNFIIKRPWENIWKFSLDLIIQSYKAKGIFDKKIIIDFFTPLLKSVDLSIDITLQQFYEYSSVELHIYSAELNHFELADISFKTHPDWLLIDAIYASCLLPNIFSPLFIEEKCFVDGGIFLNNPSSKCIENVLMKGGLIDEIFSISISAIENNNGDFENTNDTISSETNIFDFNRILIQKFLYTIRKSRILNELPPLLYELKTGCETNTVDDIINIMNSQQLRKKIIDEGIEKMQDYLDKISFTPLCN